MLERCCRAGAIGKVAVAPRSIASALGLVEIARDFSREGRRFVLIGLGERGGITRVWAREMGCAIEYLRPDRAKEVSPGMLSLSEWRAMKGRRKKVITGLVGKPIGHSISKEMQNAAFRKAGIRGAYLPFETEGRVDLVALLKRPGLKGLNITMPLKEVAVRLLDRCDPEAKEVGAVNTVLFSRGESVGYNTDVYGFRRLLERTPPRSWRRALVVGAGGAGRATSLVLMRGFADRIFIANRSPALARRLERWSKGRVEAIPMGWLSKTGPFDLVVNCTPVGMMGVRGKAIIPAGAMRKGSLLIDLVYNPPVTWTMIAARRRGARAIGGLEVLVHQGARSFELWTGRPAPIGVMRSAARRALAARTLSKR